MPIVLLHPGFTGNGGVSDEITVLLYLSPGAIETGVNDLTCRD
jgi:hypothetical protein